MLWPSVKWSIAWENVTWLDHRWALIMLTPQQIISFLISCVQEDSKYGKFSIRRIQGDPNLLLKQIIKNFPGLRACMTLALRANATLFFLAVQLEQWNRNRELRTESNRETCHHRERITWFHCVPHCSLLFYQMITSIIDASCTGNPWRGGRGADLENQERTFNSTLARVQSSSHTFTRE
jgi:hypothetical protein